MNIILWLARRSIAKKLYERGYQKSSVNNIMRALDLPETGLPKYENSPPMPKRKDEYSGSPSVIGPM